MSDRAFAVFAATVTFVVALMFGFAMANGLTRVSPWHVALDTTFWLFVCAVAFLALRSWLEPPR